MDSFDFCKHDCLKISFPQKSNDLLFILIDFAFVDLFLFILIHFDLFWFIIYNYAPQQLFKGEIGVPPRTTHL